MTRCETGFDQAFRVFPQVSGAPGIGLITRRSRAQIPPLRTLALVREFSDQGLVRVGGCAPGLEGDIVVCDDVCNDDQDMAVVMLTVPVEGMGNLQATVWTWRE